MIGMSTLEPDLRTFFIPNRASGVLGSLMASDVQGKVDGLLGLLGAM
jgi:hypothetical protein